MISEKYRGFLCVFGAFLCHFSLGSIYTFGNMSPYIASYMRYKEIPVKMDQMVWIFAFALGLQGLTMPFGGVFAKILGTRFTTLMGCWIMSFSVLISYLTVKKSIYVLVLTYGAIFGLGTGLAYSVAIAAAIKWYPTKKGLIIGLVVGGFGLGSLVFNQIQTAYINPNNISPNLTIGTDKYFNDPTMLSHVPSVFLLMGGIYSLLQTVGVLLLFEPEMLTDDLNCESTFTRSNSTVQTLECLSEGDLTERSPHSAVVSIVTTPLQALKSRDFWLLWLIFLMNGMCNMLTSSLYKTFGQNYISDDRYLAIVGSISAIFNAGGRVFWGFIMDKSNFTISMKGITGISAVFLATFYCESLIDSKFEVGIKIYHVVWVCVLLGCVCGSFAIIPSATAKIFGTENVATIYGMVFSSNAVAGFLGAVATSSLQSKIGYLGLFEIGAALLVISFILTFLFKDRTI